VILVTFTYDEHGRPLRIEAKGHAGWAKLGRDVVCAAASTLLQSAWLGISEVAGIEVDGKRGRGTLELTWSPADRASEALRLLVKTADLSIERLAEQYPRHVRSERKIGISWPSR